MFLYISSSIYILVLCNHTSIPLLHTPPPFCHQHRKPHLAAKLMPVVTKKYCRSLSNPNRIVRMEHEIYLWVEILTV